MTVIFGRVAGLPSEGNAPYAIMVLAGLLPWQFSSNALSSSSQSLVSNANLITKVYFPRMIIPSSTVIVAFVDFIVSFMILILLMIWYRFSPDWRILFPPWFVVVAFCSALGPGLFITALNVRYINEIIISLCTYVPFPINWFKAARNQLAKPTKEAIETKRTRSTR